MQSRRGPSSPESDSAPVTFQDVTACFSEEEWKLLHQWQEELYNNLMNEIHRHLISLGPVIASSVFSLRAKEKEYLCPVDDQDSVRRHKITTSPSLITPCLNVFSNSREETEYEKDPLQTDQRESSDNLNTGLENTIAVMSVTIKEEEETNPMASQNPKETQHMHSPSGFLSLAPEPEVRFTDPVDEEGREGSTGLGSGDPIATFVLLQRFLYNNETLVEEEKEQEEEDEDEQEEQQKEEEEEEDEDGGESSGMADITEVASLCIKDERDACSMDQQDSEKKECINNAISEPVATYKILQRFLHNSETLPREEEPEEEGEPEEHQVKEEEEEDGGESSAHKSETRGMNEIELNTCSELKKTSTHNVTLKQYQRMQTSERLFPCTECKKIFYIKANLLTHKKIHKGLKPFPCTDCKKSFTVKDSLKRHQRIHTGENLFSCTKCDKSFTRKVHLQCHQRTHTGVRPFSCTDCEKSFTQKIHLQCHQWTHTGVRPYSCTECGKSFTAIATLSRHLRIHTGVRPYSCTVCEKSFTQKIHLQCHQRTHTGVRSLRRALVSCEVFEDTKTSTLGELENTETNFTKSLNQHQHGF